MVLKYIKKRTRTDKNKRIINDSNKINNEFVISGEYNAKPNNNIDLDWMIDKVGMKR